MANSKISGLTAATTPLVGTEEFVLVQTNNKKIAASNVSVGALKSNATTGVMQITGPATGEIRVATVPNANFSVDYLARPGNVLQVVYGNTTTRVSSSSATYGDTSLSATITPTSVTSKILVIVDQNGVEKELGDTGVGIRLFRNTTLLAEFASLAAYTFSTATNNAGSVSGTYLDNPATTSATTYKTQFSSMAGIAMVFVQHYPNPMSTITLMEIAG